MLSQVKALRRAIGTVERPVQVDDRTFSARYSACDLAQCQGMCCYDGVVLQEPEVQVIRDLVRDELDVFHDIGIEFEDDPVNLEKSDHGSVCARTRLRSFDYEPQTKLPKHFAATACVFRCHDGRCGLQVLAGMKGCDPWYYKPMGCWMHPLQLRLGRFPSLSVGGEESPQFAACTQCGLARASGSIGYDVFRRELEVLSILVDQDLLRNRPSP